MHDETPEPVTLETEEEVPTPPLMRGDDTLSPVDLPRAPEGGRPLLWTSVTIATAAVLLLFANAATIDGWAKELPPSPAVERLTELTGRWTAFTDQAALGVPHAVLHARWKQAEAAKFD